MVEWLRYHSENIVYGMVFTILGIGLVISIIGVVETWPR